MVLATHLPLRWISNGEGLQVAGVEGMINVRFKRVDPGYFGLLDIPSLAGRGIGPQDRQGAPLAVVVNEALAARLEDVAGMANPVGQRVRISCPNYEEGGFHAEGFRDRRCDSQRTRQLPGRDAPAVAYVALAQIPRPDVRLLVRTQAEPAAVMPAIRAAIRDVDPNLPLGDVATMRQVRCGQRFLARAGRRG